MRCLDIATRFENISQGIGFHLSWWCLEKTTSTNKLKIFLAQFVRKLLFCVNSLLIANTSPLFFEAAMSASRDIVAVDAFQKSLDDRANLSGVGSYSWTTCHRLCTGRGNFLTLWINLTALINIFDHAHLMRERRAHQAVLLAHWVVNQDLILDDFAGKGTKMVSTWLLFYQVDARPKVFLALSNLLLCGNFKILDFWRILRDFGQALELGMTESELSIGATRKRVGLLANCRHLDSSGSLMVLKLTDSTTR